MTLTPPFHSAHVTFSEVFPLPSLKQHTQVLIRLLSIIFTCPTYTSHYPKLSGVLRISTKSALTHRKPKVYLLTEWLIVPKAYCLHKAEKIFTGLTNLPNRQAEGLALRPTAHGERAWRVLHILSSFTEQTETGHIPSFERSRLPYPWRLGLHISGQL